MFFARALCLPVFFLSGFSQSLLSKYVDNEDSYQALRKAVREYRATMNEYYKAVSHLLKIVIASIITFYELMALYMS